MEVRSAGLLFQLVVICLIYRDTLLHSCIVLLQDPIICQVDSKSSSAWSTSKLPHNWGMSQELQQDPEITFKSLANCFFPPMLSYIYICMHLMSERQWTNSIYSWLFSCWSPDFSFLWLPQLQYLSVPDPPRPFKRGMHLVSVLCAFIWVRCVFSKVSKGVFCAERGATSDLQCPEAKVRWICKTQPAAHLVGISLIEK